MRLASLATMPFISILLAFLATLTALTVIATPAPALIALHLAANGPNFNDCGRGRLFPVSAFVRGLFSALLGNRR